MENKIKVVSNANPICPECKKVYLTPDEYLAGRYYCSNCGANIVIEEEIVNNFSKHDLWETLSEKQWEMVRRVKGDSFTENKYKKYHNIKYTMETMLLLLLVATGFASIVFLMSIF